MKIKTQTYANALIATTFLILLCPAQSNASTIIYFDDFNDADKMGTPAGIGGDNPTISTGLYGGSGTASWSATTDGNWGSDGTKVAGTVNAFLPVSIPSNTTGVTYTITVDVTVSASSGYDWIAAGFASTTSGVFWGLGAPWMLMRGQTWPGGGTGLMTVANTVQAFPRDVENGANMLPTLGDPGQPGPYAGTFRIILDTSNTYWTVTFGFKETGGVFQDFYTHNYSESDPNPNITHVGIGAVSNGAGSVDNFSLTAIPEPSSLALISVLGVGLVTRRKRL